MKNDNLNITFSIEDYQIRILKFTYECSRHGIHRHIHTAPTVMRSTLFQKEKGL